MMHGLALLRPSSVSLSSARRVSIEEQEAELHPAKEALWAWYLEWSEIARVAANRRVRLKQLGFLASRRGGADEDAEVESPPATTPSVASAPAN